MLSSVDTTCQSIVRMCDCICGLSHLGIRLDSLDEVLAARARLQAAGLATAAYDLLNVSVGYNLTLRGQVNTITLRVDNLFDERYADATSRIKTFAFNPGRNFALVYRLQF